MSQLPHITPKMRRLCLKAAMRILLETGGVDEFSYNEIVAEIDAIPDEELQPKVQLPFFGNEDEDENYGNDLSDATEDYLRAMAKSDDADEAERAKNELARRGIELSSVDSRGSNLI